MSLSEGEAAGSNPDPATKTDLPPLFDVAKGGGEVKKKHRCFVKRFAALVAALVLCSALCVPCFASNNASTKKWVVVAEDQKRGENGLLTRYLKVSPYVDGAQYATIIETNTYSELVSSGVYDKWAVPLNYPEWWRSDLPLGYTSYVELSSATVLSASYTDSSGFHPVSDAFLIPFDKRYSLTATFSRYSSATSFTGSLLAFPVQFYGNSGTTVALFSSSGILLPSPAETSIKAFSGLQNLVPAMSYDKLQGWSYLALCPFANASSSQLIWAAFPVTGWDSSNVDRWYAKVSVVISYWIDANKLPAGLQIGDEFPADTDAFDQLRDDLIDQFPEASENIQNGKDTLTGWNDTETVDTDVASSAMSALNAMFQNLGSFLFFVSLMVFGAVVLRMFIRKAVDG